MKTHARGSVDETIFMRLTRAWKRQGVGKMTGERRLKNDPDHPEVIRFEDGPRAWRYVLVEEEEAYERLLMQRSRGEKPRPTPRPRSLKTDAGDTVRLCEIKSVIVTTMTGKKVRIANMAEVLSYSDGIATAASKTDERGGAR